MRGAKIRSFENRLSRMILCLSLYILLFKSDLTTTKRIGENSLHSMTSKDLNFIIFIYTKCICALLFYSFYVTYLVSVISCFQLESNGTVSKNLSPYFTSSVIRFEYGEGLCQLYWRKSYGINIEAINSLLLNENLLSDLKPSHIYY